MLGFGVGGFGLGVGVWGFLNSAPIGSIYEGDAIYMILGFLAFGFAGGIALGLAYTRLAKRIADNAREDSKKYTWDERAKRILDHSLRKKC